MVISHKAIVLLPAANIKIILKNAAIKGDFGVSLVRSMSTHFFIIEFHNENETSYIIALV
jgi:hypothetical protein